VCCRHAAEQVHEPRALVRTAMQAAGFDPNARLYFEVPNSLYTHPDLGIWDLICEYRSYFCGPSLSMLFETVGLEVMEVYEAFGGQFSTKVNQWMRRLDQLRESRLRFVVPGGGSTGVTFLNMLRTRDIVPCVVDANLRKAGMFVPGTGQPFVAPGELPDYRPDIMVVMNPLYREVISRTPREMGLNCGVVDA